jgi:hypothetical protein
MQLKESFTRKRFSVGIDMPIGTLNTVPFVVIASTLMNILTLGLYGLCGGNLKFSKMIDSASHSIQQNQ